MFTVVNSFLNHLVSDILLKDITHIYVREQDKRDEGLQMSMQYVFIKYIYEYVFFALQLLTILLFKL